MALIVRRGLVPSEEGFITSSLVDFVGFAQKGTMWLLTGAGGGVAYSVVIIRKV